VPSLVPLPVRDLPSLQNPSFNLYLSRDVLHCKDRLSRDFPPIFVSLKPVPESFFTVPNVGSVGNHLSPPSCSCLVTSRQTVVALSLHCKIFPLLNPAKLRWSSILQPLSHPARPTPFDDSEWPLHFLSFPSRVPLHSRHRQLPPTPRVYQCGPGNAPRPPFLR